MLDQTTQVNRMTLRKSTNDGGYWDQFLLSDVNSCAYSVLPNPVNDNVIYVGGEIASSNGSTVATIFKTTDKGTAWTRIGMSTFTQSSERVNVLQSDMNNPNRIFAGTNYALFRSTDAGASWSKIISNGDVNSVLIDPSNANTIYCTTRYNGVQLSTDGGATWKDFNENLGSMRVECMDFDATNGALYVGTTDYGVFRRFVSGGGGVQPPPSSWSYKANTGKNATVAVNASIDPKIGTQSLRTDDAIGVFFSRGDSLICAGYTLWKTGQNTAITAWGDDDQSTMKDGFAEGEALRFRIWDATAGKAYDAVAQYSLGSGLFTANGLYVLSSLTATTISTHRIVLQQGWNIISSYITPRDSTLDSVFVKIRPRMVIAKNSAGQVYWPAYSINTIGKWNQRQGYQINMQSQDTLTVSGDEINPQQVTLTLPQGWNMVAYLRNCGMRADSALASITAGLVIAKNGAGQVYWPVYGINTIGNMRPGQGYQVYLTSSATLAYPANTGPAPPGQLTKLQWAATRQEAEATHFLSASARTGVNSTLLIEGSALRDGDEVGAWTSSGLLVGSGVVENGKAILTVWGDDPSTDSREGAREHEALFLKQWLQAQQKVQSLEITGILDVLGGGTKQGALHFEADGVSMVSVSGQASVVPAWFELGQNYPNPFNPTTAISYQLPAISFVTLRVFDMLGREVATLVNEICQPGVYAVHWDASSFPSGVYVYRLQAGANVASRKMVLVK